MFKPLEFYRSTLKYTLTKDAVQVTPKTPYELAIGEYTRLHVTDGVHHEIIKIERVADGELVTRGAEGTTPFNFPMGACIKYYPTTANIRDLMSQCGTEGGSGIELLSDDLAISRVDTDDANDSACTWQINFKKTEGDPLKWQSCDAYFTYKDGTITKRAKPATQLLKDGCYPNAVVTIKDGCIKSVVAGDVQPYPLHDEPCDDECGESCNGEDDPDAEPTIE